MLKVVVYVGENEVARAIAENDSELADVSDYNIRMNERAAKQLGIKEKGLGGRIKGHPRNLTAWALVRKIANLWLAGTGVGEESVQAELLPMIRKSIRELDERVENEPNQSDDWNAVVKQISDDEPCSLGFYADKFESWTADEIEALRCDVFETATEEELMAEVERRRRAGLMPKEASNDGFSDMVDDLWGKLDTDPDR
ncbi:hypothetical protein RA28_00580 [Ruegeria sp. ANG-S4]|uniref:hypothetical protein n=1 Tax=Ruegeria sp. ANG-S4 TaxID=1577904 RepID=UPI00057F5DB4|nr:hypothetical protein [Ruegeria sp. ANG-S4]KIC46342.1 hypothetical protein RA28_00580 [Ruegeria sp. ANG-S4]